jgi:hypothetical protein
MRMTRGERKYVREVDDENDGSIDVEKRMS